MSNTITINKTNANSHISDGHLTIDEQITSVTIENNTFINNAQLKNVTFPMHLNKLKIGFSAFQNCQNLAEVAFNPPENAAIEIFGEAFSGCQALKNIELPYGIKNLPMALFESCISLNKVIIPNSVDQIASDAFQGCPADCDLQFHDRPTATDDSLKGEFKLLEDRNFSIYQSFVYNGQTKSFCLKQKEDQAKVVSFQVVTSKNKQNIQPTNGNESLYAIIAPFFSDLSNDPDITNTTQAQCHTIQLDLDNKNKMVISLNRMHIKQPIYSMLAKPTLKHSHQVLFIYPISDTLRITLSHKIDSTKLPQFTTEPNKNDLLVFVDFRHQNIFSSINAILLEKNESSGKIKMIKIDGSCKNTFAGKKISLDDKKLISLKFSHNQSGFPKIKFKDFFNRTTESLKTEYPAVNNHNCSQYFDYDSEDSFGSSVFEYNDDVIAFFDSKNELKPISTHDKNPYDALTKVIKNNPDMQNTSITDASSSFKKTGMIILESRDHFKDWKFSRLKPILDLRNKDSIHSLSTLEDFQMKAAGYGVNTQFFAVDVFLKLLLEINFPHMNSEPIKGLKTILELNVIDNKIINAIKDNFKEKGQLSEAQFHQIFNEENTQHANTPIITPHTDRNMAEQGIPKQNSVLQLIQAYFKLNGERIDPKSERIGFMHILHAIRKFFKNLFGESLESKCIKAFRNLLDSREEGSTLKDLSLSDIKETHDQALNDYNSGSNDNLKHPSFDRLFKQHLEHKPNELEDSNSKLTPN